MDYIQEMISISNDSNLSLEGDERDALVSFTDEMVKFRGTSNRDFINCTELKNALHKIIDKGMFIRYFEVLMKRNEYTMDNFSERMEEK